ncbi:MAG TPA: SpoIIE family protein phosphatase [Vicinamibacteria bacterium]|nr:SpoIIE family protein phosphatase [Vicinamibacteria bacterium]
MKALTDCRLLLVDDAKANLDILVEGLKGDYKLTLALSGEMALKLAQHMPPDLVLLDIMMPGLDGYEVCRRLRQMPETAEVPIVFLSSLEDVQDKSRAFEAGANDYVTKPFDLREVKARVRALLKAKAYSDAVKEQLAADLRVAHEIQMGMIPQDFGGLERNFGVELAGEMVPAREVGGDLYGAFPGAGGRLVLLMGDVSGKGIPASLFMVRASSLARLLGRDILEPERILARLNDELSADNPSGMFVTMLCAVFDPSSGRVALANAGHNRPVILGQTAGPRWAVDRLGTALGFEPGLRFERTDLQLQPGDTLVLYTDGVNEAFDPQAECYGNERLLRGLAELADQSAAAVTAGLLQQVRAFAAGAPQSDDIAILTLRRVGQTVASPRFTLELQATPADVMRAVEAVRVFGRERQVDEGTLFGLALALEECGTNIVTHACGGRAHERFRVAFERTAATLEIEVRDCGPAFDPTQSVARELPTTDEDRPPGGWGLQLVRHYLDEVRYSREGDENVLRLVKRVASRDS